MLVFDIILSAPQKKRIADQQKILKKVKKVVDKRRQT
jgi:hypothetical protein